ncbi:hypothetical protein M9194_04245 [Vibrio sp. S4M6]|uniref:hypothetical protein n=1 Tax=Vibrio sinus TaxID=2946865 RepID=UPI00202A3D80|nr:hypothetical protein [Vibrio sinus]MCL9780646.1 hypothetical protein [Vibrio sinus]
MEALFHYALRPVVDIEPLLAFYRDKLKMDCKLVTVNGDEKQLYVDFFGHNLAFAENKKHEVKTAKYSADELQRMRKENFVPDTHFGVFFQDNGYSQFKEIIRTVESSGIKYLVHPTVCEQGTSSEQAFFFIQDPELNIIEIRALTKQFDLNNVENNLQNDKTKRNVLFSPS